ncbi:MAG: hypothetical protein C0469_11225, partial [Cyanobacteria bacterium DS2.3.42]|nr:hypothetical protein [Cyanobacteria bacterium DS2.3.42]
MNNEGVKALNAGNFALAIQKFEAALQMDKSYQLARENLAIAHNNYGLQLAKSNPQEALKQFHQAYYLNKTNATTAQNVEGIIRMLGKDPRDFKTRVAMADQARMSGDFVGAIVEYAEALKIKDDPKIHIKLGDVYRVRDNVDDAIKEYQGAARSGDSAEVEVKLGQALQAKGDLPGAVAAFGRALGFNPTDSDTLDALQAAWEDALKKDPLAPDNHIGLGQALQFRGDFGGATAEYKQAIQLSKGNNPTAQRLLAALPDLIKKATIDKHINNGVDLQAKKLYAPALEEYKLALQAAPNNPDIWVNMGTVYQAQEDYPKAIEAYQKALQIDPRNTAAAEGFKSCNQLLQDKQIAQSEGAAGDAYKAGRYDDAVKLYSALVQKDPKNAAYYYNRGAAEQMLKQFDQAMADYNTALGLDPKNKTYSNAMESAKEAKVKPIIDAAVAKHKAEDYLGAIDGYQAALAIQPDNAPLWFNLASAQYAMENYSRARDAYQKALEVDPKGQVNDLYLMAVIDEHYGKGPQAQGEYLKYVSQAPNGQYYQAAKERLAALNKDPNATIKIKGKAEKDAEKAADEAVAAAANLNNAGKTEEAIGFIQKAIALQPKEPEYYAVYGSYLQKLGKIDDAIAQYKQAASIDPKNPKNKEYLEAVNNATGDKVAPIADAAVKLQQDGKYQEAIAKYQEAIALLPTSGPLYRNMGSAYQAADDFNNAFNSYKKAYSVDPKGEVNCLYFMAVIDENYKRGQAAFDKYNQYKREAPNGQFIKEANARIAALSKNVADTLTMQTQAEAKANAETEKLSAQAIDAYNQKNYDVAIGLYQQIAQLKPKEASVPFALGAIYQQKEDWDNAIKYFQQAVSMDPKNKQYADALAAAKASAVGPVMNDGYQKQTAGDFAGAIPLYEQGLKQYPNNAAGWTSLAACYQATDNFQKAYDAYKKGYDLDQKGQVGNLYFMGILDENFGKGNQAWNEYQDYVKRDPRGAYASDAQSRIARLGKNVNDVQKLTTSGDAKKQGDAAAAYEAAVKLQTDQKYDESIAKYKEAIGLLPNNDSFVYGMGTCYQAKGDIDLAIEAYKKALSMAPTNANYKGVLAGAQQIKAAPLIDSAIKKQTDAAKPDLPGAILDYEAALKLWNDPSTHMNLGTAYQAANNLNRAMTEYNTALQMDPKTCVECYYYRGTLWEALKNIP